jgi:choline/glycine/proline betaine transport protein
VGRLQEHFRQHTNPPVFFISVAVIVAFVLWGIFAAGNLGTVAGAVFAWIGEYAGWWYIIAASGFVIITLVIAFSRWGRIKLGPDDARPEFSTFAWFSMLFTAGMGIGLVFYGVAEPATYLTSGDAPVGEPGTAGAATESLKYTLFHWGLHPWAIYVILGAGLGYFAFRRGLPLRPSSALYPLIGDRVHGSIGNVIDILAVFGTLFGLATSLGLGASQISDGLNRTYGAIPNTVTTQVIIIAVLTLIAVISVMLGIEKGIRRLSLGNMVLAIILAAVVFIVGPTLVILQYLTSGLGNYLQTLPQTSVNLFPGDSDAQAWQQGWTIFYWGWWISWSPFVGMFIARISYGMSLRKFIVGAMIAPTLASSVWFAIFGGGAMSLIVGGNNSIAEAGTTGGMFAYISALPLAGVLATALSLLAIIVVSIFFATSSDSGSLVIDILTNGGDPDPDWRQRMFWAITEGAVGAILLIAGAAAGGDPLGALQTASVAAGLPFSIVLALVAWGLLKGLSEERAPDTAPAPDRPATRPAGSATRTTGVAPQQVQHMSAEDPTEGRNRRR